MKTKIKRHSRSVMSIILTISMLISTMMVGLIATDAAKTSGGENVSAKAVDEATVGAKVADEATVGAKTADEDTVGAQATDEATVGANAADEDTVGANVADEETVGAIAADESSVGAINTSGLMFRIWKKGESTATETTLSAKDVYYDVITTGASKELWGFQLKDGDNNYYDNGENLAEEADIGNGKNFVWMNNTTKRGERNVYLDASSTYQVCYNQVDDGNGKIQINIRKKITTATGWYLVGGYDWGDWSTSNTSYPFTLSGNYYEREITVTKNTYFRVHNGVSQYNCSDTSDTTLTVSDDWSSLSVGSAKALMVAAGTYKIQIDNTNTKIRLQSVAPTQSRLTVGTTNDAVVTATYNGVTKGEGEYFEYVPQGAVISVSVVPDSAKKCTGITSTGGGTITGSGNSYTLTMPAAVTTVTATITDVTLRSIYFNNGNTLYSMVFAYVEDAAGYKYLGAYPGKAMTKLSNSNIWEIQVPDDSTTVIFRGTNNANTGTMTIPWSTTNNKPKYTPPYGHNDAPTIGNGGTWGEYKSRTNEITVTDGANMNRRGIFTGVNATFYDYYVDNEVDGTWRTSINSSTSPYDYSDDNGSNYKWNPYTKLNDELSRYAAARSVAYPLYFGNLNLSTYTNGQLDFSNVGHGTQATVEAYHNWAASTKANNSVYLGSGNDSKAVIGLTGKTLANSTIHYYSASDTENENGVAMAMFDEDFLSGENYSGKNLAQILRSNSFPVRKLYEGASATITYENKIYVDAGEFQVQGEDEGADGKLWAHFSDGGSDDKLMTYDSVSGYYICDIPTDCTKVTFVRTKAAATGVVWEGDVNFWNKSDTYDVETSTSSASRLYTFTNYANNIGKFSKGSIGTEYGATFSNGHTYYKFDSQYGKDNAYITDVDGTTAQLSYYSDKDGKFVHAAKLSGTYAEHKGFFPFDYAQAGTGDGGLAHDLGFGMKLEIPFTLNENGLNEDDTAQTFDFSGDDDLWVFIDNKLVLDLGGAHSRTTGTINFNKKKITGTSTDNVGNSVSRNGDFEIGTTANDVNTVHTMTIYYMERGMYDSNLMFGFSFHAVPDMLMVDKKVRTYDVNSGFFTANTNTTAYDTNNQVVKNDKGDPITQFEYTYQAALALEPFGITQKSSNAPVNGGITYTIDSVPTTIAAQNLGPNYSFGYNLYNDQVAYFASQIPLNTSGSTASTVTLAETIPNNSKYKYTTEFSATNIANGNSEIAFTSSNGEYTFAMPEGSTTGLLLPAIRFCGLEFRGSEAFFFSVFDT